MFRASSFSLVLLYIHRDHKYYINLGQGAQDSHLEFNRAPEAELLLSLKKNLSIPA